MQKELKVKKCACGNPLAPNRLACSECYNDLHYKFSRCATAEGMIHMADGDVTLEEYIECLIKSGLRECGKCCFCGESYVFGGNNPYPANTDEDAACCDRCNNEVVIPARLKILFTNLKK